MILASGSRLVWARIPVEAWGGFRASMFFVISDKRFLGRMIWERPSQEDYPRGFPIYFSVPSDTGKIELIAGGKLYPCESLRASHLDWEDMDREFFGRTRREEVYQDLQAMEIDHAALGIFV